MKIKISKPLGVLFLLAATSFIPTANAALTSCGTSGSLYKEDITFRSDMSDDCSGVYSGNNSEDLATFNAETGITFGGSDWEATLKADNLEGASSTGSTNFLDINWTLSADSGTTGDWNLNIGSPASNLPLTLDILTVVKAGTGWAAYLFEDELFDTTGDNAGSFLMRLANNGGTIANISHLSVYMRDASSFSCPPGQIERTIGNVTTCEDPDVTPIPEPAPLFLISTGIIGFWVNRKNLRKAK